MFVVDWPTFLVFRDFANFEDLARQLRVSEVNSVVGGREGGVGVMLAVGLSSLCFRSPIRQYGCRDNRSSCPPFGFTYGPATVLHCGSEEISTFFIDVNPLCTAQRITRLPSWRRFRNKDTNFCSPMRWPPPECCYCVRLYFAPLTICGFKMRVVRDRLVLNVDEFIRRGFH